MGVAAWRRSFWRALGATVSDDGQFVPGHDDWLLVFVGRPVDARLVQDALDDAGIESRGEVYVPRLVVQQVEPKAEVCVRGTVLAEATAIVAELPVVANEVPARSAPHPNRPAVARFAAGSDADRAIAALEAAGLRVWIDEGGDAYFGSKDVVVRVAAPDLGAAVAAIEGLADADPSFTALDVAREHELGVRHQRLGTNGWLYLGLLLCMAVLGAIGVALMNPRPSELTAVILVLALPWAAGAWFCLRRFISLSSGA